MGSLVYAMPERRIEVDDYSGGSLAECPRSFRLGDSEVRVVQILRRWREEKGEDRSRSRFFRVRGSDGKAHLLGYDERRAEWYYRGGSPR